MGVVTPIAPQSRVDEAWDEVLAYEVRQLQKPDLRIDRSFQEALCRARFRYERLLRLKDHADGIEH
jgi:hypothetical protein